MRGQLNIRIDDAHKARWQDAARSQALDLTAWITLHLDAAALEAERARLFDSPPQRTAAAPGAYSR